MLKYIIHSTNCRTKMTLILKENDQSQITQKTVHNNRDTKESKKYGCVCTCCHRNNLPWYHCIIFVRQNYNFNIPAVANALSK